MKTKSPAVVVLSTVAFVLSLTSLSPCAQAQGGLPLWTNFYNGPTNYSHAKAVAVDGSGNMFVTGYAATGNGSDFDYVTVKYSNTGAPLWTNRYAGSADGWDDPCCIAVDSSGDVIVTFSMRSSGAEKSARPLRQAPDRRQFNKPCGGQQAQIPCRYTAGFQLTQFNLMIRLAPASQRPAYVAVFLAFTSFLTAAGPILGSAFLRSLPEQVGQLLGHPILNFHVLFSLAAFGCTLTANLISRVQEPAEQPVFNVWREMRTMRSFNPMLSVLSVGELLLTPRGLVALARRSLRKVRQQVKAIEDVGEEIVTGGREALGKPRKP